LNIVAPSSNGAPITAYKVYFFDKTQPIGSEYQLKTTLCNGALIVATRTCQIPMVEFSSTLGYSKGQFIKF